MNLPVPRRRGVDLSPHHATASEWIVGGLALVLGIFLLTLPWFRVGFVTLPWFHVDLGPFSVTSTATEAPDGWAAILAVLAAFAVVVDLAVQRFAPQPKGPTFRETHAVIRLLLAATAVAFTALKFLLQIHVDYFGWGFYVIAGNCAALLSAAVVASRDRAVVSLRAEPPEPVSAVSPGPS